MTVSLIKFRRWAARKLRVLLVTRSILRILNRGHGHRLSVRQGYPVDSDGRAIPWFTYPAIEFLSQFDFSQLSVFEFGAGQSTLYWEARARRVTSVESDAGWYAHLKVQIGPTVDLIFAEDVESYVGRLSSRDETFDVIVVDGIARSECCHAARSRLRRGGMIILDNSERYPDYSESLRASGLLQVDMSGFGPVNDYAWTTSIFFHREFDFPHKGDGRPHRGIGSIPHLRSDRLI